MTLGTFVYITFPPADVIQHPTDTEVHAGDTATFMCGVGDAPSAFWKINNTNIVQLPSAAQADISWDFVEEINTYVLTILAKPEYDLTVVQCVAVSESEQVGSETALLYIG